MFVGHAPPLVIIVLDPMIQQHVPTVDNHILKKVYVLMCVLQVISQMLQQKFVNHVHFKYLIV